MDIIKEFMQLFKGLDRAYVRVPIKSVEVKAGEKVEASAFTVHEDVTPEIWDLHLKGEENLSIIPIMDNAKVNFGAIDIDDYTINFRSLEDKLNKLGIPLIVCRSKSGGAHLYLFLEHAMSAKFIVSKLRMFAMVLGYSYEIFPKQIRLANKRDTGNGISVPYYGGDDSNRYAFHNNKRLTIDQFLRLAHKRRISKEDLTNFQIEIEGELRDAPPCLQVLSQSGIPAGYRNDGLFSFGVFCKRKFGDDWKSKLEEFNQKVCSPALQATEMLGILRSLSKENKDYFYKCAASPLVNCCNKEECRKLEYGIGTHDEIQVTISSLVKIATEPPIYIMQLDDQRIELTSAQLLNFGQFRNRVFETLNVLLPRLKNKQWDIEVSKLLETLEIRLAPENMTPAGKLLEHLEAYCTGNNKSNHKQILVTGGVWIDGDYTYIRGTKFEEYLQRLKFTELPSNKITSIFKTRLEAEHCQFTILRKSITCWRIKSFAQQNEEFEKPRVEGDM